MGAGVGFAASEKAFKSALTTCVASDAFSRRDSSFFSAEAAALPLLVLVLAAVFARGRGAFVAQASSLGISRLLRRAVVAGEHVETAVVAPRTASAWAERSMKMSRGLILNHIIANS